MPSSQVANPESARANGPSRMRWKPLAYADRGRRCPSDVVKAGAAWGSGEDRRWPASVCKRAAVVTVATSGRHDVRIGEWHFRLDDGGSWCARLVGLGLVLVRRNEDGSAVRWSGEVEVMGGGHGSRCATTAGRMLDASLCLARHGFPRFSSRQRNWRALAAVCRFVFVAMAEFSLLWRELARSLWRWPTRRAACDPRPCSLGRACFGGSAARRLSGQRELLSKPPRTQPPDLRRRRMIIRPCLVPAVCEAGPPDRLLPP